MSGLDLSTAAGALRFAELRRAEMRAQFLAEGRFDHNGFALECFVFLSHAVEPPPDPSDLDRWRTGPRLARVRAERIVVERSIAAALIETGCPEAASGLVAATVRHYARLGRAVGVLTLAEQWTGTTATREERAARPARIEQWPDRRECLYARLEHRATGARTWLALIEREPTRLGPWTTYDTPAVEGNLVDLLEPAGWTS